MNSKAPLLFKVILVKRIFTVSFILLLGLIAAIFLELCFGSSDSGVKDVFKAISGSNQSDPVLTTIIWHIRFPRALLAALAGATLSLGGLVFQALLKNPLAEPYILGVSGGSAIGAIIGILLNLSRFPGVSATAFAGSIVTLFLILVISSGKTIFKKDSLLLSGVMVNSFCSAGIMFLISMTHDSRLHNIIFWLMGDFSLTDIRQVIILAITLIPCFILIFMLSNSMNLLLLGKESASAMGVNIKAVTITLLVVSSFMVSATVCYCGLLGFVGLVVPHMLRLFLGSDHRLLVPASILGGGAYMTLCDLLARILPKQGEMPVGVITAMIGAPLFVFLLRKTVK